PASRVHARPRRRASRGADSTAVLGNHRDVPRRAARVAVSAAREGPFAILGLGLMGGSMARDLAARGATVLGFDSDRRTLNAARRSGVIAKAIDESLEQLRGART